MVKMSKGDKDARVAADEMARLLEHLNNGNPASTFEAKGLPAFAAAWHELGLLTAKKSSTAPTWTRTALPRTMPM